jgi:hypothetical protein
MDPGRRYLVHVDNLDELLEMAPDPDPEIGTEPVKMFATKQWMVELLEVNIASLEACAAGEGRPDGDRPDYSDELAKQRAFLRWVRRCPKNDIYIGIQPASEYTLKPIDGPDQG